MHIFGESLEKKLHRDFGRAILGEKILPDLGLAWLVKIHLRFFAREFQVVFVFKFLQIFLS